ncbi:ribonuclease H-like domain-containing protein [Tanacetum coccineum]
MTGNKSYLRDYQDIDGGFVAFARSPKGEKITSKGGLTCLIAKATIYKSNLWHMRLGHINFKTMNKLVRGNLVRGLPLKIFENDHSCVACQKGKQHKASWIKREFSVARTPQQNRTLIEAARTMLADLLLPTTFWAEVVNTACYVQNRVLVTKPHNKTPYKLLLGRPPSISFMIPFGCPVTILNSLDPLGKFDGKADEGFLVGYSINSKAFRVFNSRTRKVEENLHINFLENKPNVAGSGLKWLFDIDSLTKFMNYEPIIIGNQTNSDAVLKAHMIRMLMGYHTKDMMIKKVMLTALTEIVLRPSTEKIKFVKSARETVEKGNPQQKEYKEKGVIDSGCSRHMTGNKCYLTEYEDYDGNFVFFRDGKGRISSKGKIKAGTLDFDNVYFCKELKYNLFSVS